MFGARFADVWGWLASEARVHMIASSTGMTDPIDEHPIERVLNTGEAAVAALRRFFAGYFWLILKNVVGWLLILGALPIGIALPGPGGLPMFLIGFALVAFPSKRRITSHVLRGRPLRIEASIFTSLTTVMSLLVISVLLWVIGERYRQLIAYFQLDPERSTPGFIAAVAGVCIIAAIVTFAVMRLSLLLTNKILRLVPRIRRMIRPYLRKMGIVLLPPPRPGTGDASGRQGAEILEFSATSRERYVRWWNAARPWVRRFLGLGVTAALLYYVIEPIVRGWYGVEWRVNLIRPVEFVVAVALGALFLVVFRVFPWWVLLSVFGYRLHGAPATRIWVTSNLAKYLPGIVSQLKVRAALARPYNVDAATCITTHVLERILFVIANIVFATVCLLLLGMGRIESDRARWWMVVAICVMPLLLPLLHPRVFYSVINRIVLASGRPRLQTNVRGWTLAAALLWKIGGLAFMSFVIWIICNGPLGLPLGKWWLVGGIYCVAWLAGFIAFWAPGGIGVREAVFMTLLLLALPNYTLNQFSIQSLEAFAGVLALVLRVWSIACEILVTLVSYFLDVQGALDSVRGQTIRSPVLRKR